MNILFLLLLLVYTAASSPISGIFVPIFEGKKSSLTKYKNYDAKMTNDRNLNLQDYHPVDPAPADLRATIKYGPIEHGTPVIPYIPKPTTPPYSPIHAVSPSPS